MRVSVVAFAGLFLDCHLILTSTREDTLDHRCFADLLAPVCAAIINYILNGAIIRAIEALNTHFPTVLDPTSASAEPVPTPRAKAWGTNGSRVPSAASTPAHPLPLLSLAPSSASTINPSGSTSGPTPSTRLGHSVPVFVASTHPVHVRLNLQIQQFIESFRQLAPSSPSSSTSSVASLTTSMVLPGGSGHMNGSKLSHSDMAMAVDGLLTPATPTGLATMGSGIPPKVTLTNALTAAQGLHTEAKKLSPDVRATYLQEIKDVGALFAYTDPETSILKGFLDQHRRIALADQVNRAILRESQGSSLLIQKCHDRGGRVFIEQCLPVGEQVLTIRRRIRRLITNFPFGAICAADNSDLWNHVRTRSRSETSMEGTRDRRRGPPGCEWSFASHIARTGASAD